MIHRAVSHLTFLWTTQLERALHDAEQELLLGLLVLALLLKDNAVRRVEGSGQRNEAEVVVLAQTRVKLLDFLQGDLLIEVVIEMGVEDDHDAALLDVVAPQVEIDRCAGVPAEESGHLAHQVSSLSGHNDRHLLVPLLALPHNLFDCLKSCQANGIRGLLGAEDKNGRVLERGFTDAATLVEEEAFEIGLPLPKSGERNHSQTVPFLIRVVLREDE